MSSDCLLHQVPSSASRFLKGIPAELLEHTCHMELLNKAPARRDTNGANFAQQPPRPPAAHAISNRRRRLTGCWRRCAGRWLGFSACGL